MRGGQVAKKSSKSKRKQPRASLLSRIPPQTRNAVLAGLAGLGVIWGVVWAYYKYTTIPVPPLASTKAEEVCSYLGDARGFSRLSIPKREEFLIGVYQQFNTEQGVQEFNQALRSMSMQEREVFLDATMEVGRARVMEFADEYNKLPRGKDRSQFVDKVITNFRTLQGDLGGKGNPSMNVGEPFKPFAPQRSDEWSKMLVTKTTARERAKAQPLIDAISKRLKEMENLQRRG
jgi:hypothetical protein